MAITRACVAVALLALAATAGAEILRYSDAEDELPSAGRQLLQTDSQLLVADDGNDSSIYQLASRTFGDVYYFSGAQGWSLTNLTASLELDAAATYASSFNAGKPGTWRAGSTRFNMTVNITRSGSGTSGNYVAPAISARLHTVVCTDPELSVSLLSSDPSGNETASPAAALGVNLTANGNNLSNSTVYPYLVDYDEAQSIVVYANGMMLGCRNLDAPFPDFPNDWSSTIEMTDVNRGFTFVMLEAYSTSLNKLRLDLHSFGSDRILLIDAAANATTTVTPGNGSCSASAAGRQLGWLTGDDNATLLSTAELLRFSGSGGSSRAQYQPGFVDVRGIPCEVWTSAANITSPRFNATFNVSYYFPVNAWLAARESYHRMLKRVAINGSRNGQPWQATQEFVNFRPRSFTGQSFDVCAISPYGQGCNCTDARRRAAYSNLTALAAAETGSDIAVDRAAAAACQFGGSLPHGFVSAQAGPYIGMLILGLAVGAAAAWLGTFCFYRKRTGVRITTQEVSQPKLVTTPSSAAV